MKRILILLLCMGLILTACQGKPGKESEDASTPLTLKTGDSKEPISVPAVHTVAYQQSVADAATFTVTELKTNGATTPLGLDERPSFSWLIDSSCVGAKQTAYEILLKDKDGKQIWDSGKVESQRQTGIQLPEEISLLPKTAYSWEVTVWDEKGTPHACESPATFSTGLMDTSLTTWSGAKFVGSETPSFEADTLDIFKVSFDFQLKNLSSGARFGFIFGANEPRLSKATFNDMLIGEENYIEFYLDLSSLSTTGAQLVIYRKGYSQEDVDGAVFRAYTVDPSLLSSENISAWHTFEIEEIHNATEHIYIDGTLINEDGSFSLHPHGKITNATMYPSLNDVGFHAQNCVAEVRNFSISNYDAKEEEDDESEEAVERIDYVPAILYNKDVGSGYSIFAGTEGVTVTADSIVLDNARVTADPSQGGATYLRKELHVESGITSATLYVTSRGVYEFYINGQRVVHDSPYCEYEGVEYAEEYFNPGSDVYWASMQYSVYDVTSYLLGGENALGAIVSSGWWCDQMSFTAANRNFWGENYGLMAMLEIRFDNGEIQTIVTDESWTYSVDGPITYSGFFQGEYYDARKEANVAGFSTTEFEGSWQTACEVLPRPDVPTAPAFTSMTNTPVHVYEVLEGELVSVETRGTGEGEQTVYIYDMGLNMTGIPSVSFPQLPEGTAVYFRYAEMLYPVSDETYTYVYGDLEGLPLVENYRGARSIDRYIANGAETSLYEPSFTFHGYRYVEISFTGLTVQQEQEAIEGIKVRGLVLSSIEELTSSYTSSNEAANQLFLNIQRSTLANHLSVPTDCNQRDERQAYSGDAASFADTAVYLADMSNMYKNFSRMMHTASLTISSHAVGPVTPEYVRDFEVKEYDESRTTTGRSAGICWAQGYIRVGYAQMMQTGDTSIVKENWEGYKEQMATFSRTRLEGFSFIPSSSATLGDWLSLEETSTNYVEAMMYGYNLKLMAKMAQLLSEEDPAYEADYTYFQEQLDGFVAEFNTLMLNKRAYPKIDGVQQKTQAALALPLAFGFVEEGRFDTVMSAYKELCSDNKLYAGFMASPWILQAFSQYGMVEEAYSMFENEAYPSWLYPVTLGATSIWERLNSFTLENGFGNNNSMNSFNHYAFGSVGNWMLQYQAGISYGDTPGFNSFVLQPTVGGSYTFLQTSYKSHCGVIESSWTADSGTMTSYSCTIPANAEATLYLPVSENSIEGMSLPDVITFHGMYLHNGTACACFTLSAGSYTFSMEGDICQVEIG